MSQLALDLGVPSTLVTEAVYARTLSALKDARLRASKVLRGPPESRYTGDRQKFIDAVRHALYASKICSYAQGFVQLEAAAKGALSGRWIMAASRCSGVAAALSARRSWNESKKHSTPIAGWKICLLAPLFSPRRSNRLQDAWRHVIVTAVQLGLPVPAFTTALSYFDGIRRPRLPANLLQAQRDYFGAHTYQRIDKPGTFHSDWLRLRKPPA